MNLDQDSREQRIVPAGPMDGIQSLYGLWGFIGIGPYLAREFRLRYYLVRVVCRIYNLSFRGVGRGLQ